MNRFPSGFAFEENGEMLYIVDSAFYPVRDDRACFEISCLFHKIKNKKLDTNFEIRRADIEYVGPEWEISIDFRKDGMDEFRVYKVLEA